MKTPIGQKILRNLMNNFITVNNTSQNKLLFAITEIGIENLVRKSLTGLICRLSNPDHN